MKTEAMNHAGKHRFATIRALASAALVLSAVAAQAALPARFAGTPTAKDYPNADVLVLSEHTAYTLMPDGRIQKKVDRIEKILTYHGMDAIGDPKVAFNKTDQDLKIETYRTYTPEGRVVDAKPNSFNEMTPFQLEKAPAYTDWRQMVMTKVGLDVNAVTETVYTLTDKKPWRRFLGGVEVLAGDEPALERTVSVTVPDGMDLHYRLFNAKADPQTAKKGESVTYMWTLKNVALVPRGERGGPEDAFLPTLVFTTCPNWGHQASIIGGLVKAADEKTSPALDKKVDALLEGAQGDFEKVVKLHDYVAEDINTVRWPLYDFQFTPRTAADVYDSGYGHALDKAVLLCAMLKHAGFDCAVAAGTPTVEGGVDPALVPCMAQMDTVLVRVEMGKQPLWLDPAATLTERSQRDFVPMKGLPLIPGMGELHTMTFDGPNELSVSLKAKAAEDLSLEGTGLFTFSGQYSPFFEMQGGQKEQKAFADKLLASALPGAEMTGYSVRRLDPTGVGLTISFKRPAPGKGEKAKALTLGIPAGSSLKGIHQPYLGARRLPLVLKWPGSERVSIEVKLPKDVKPLYVPGDLSLTNAAGSLGQTWTNKDGVIKGTWKINLPARVIKPEDYSGFRNLYGLACAQADHTVLFN